MEELDPDVVAPLGDLVYETGSPKEFSECYEPSWGRFKDRTRPAPGNHEYLGDPKATGYYDYFGKRAHGRRGYYSYGLRSWRVFVLNSQLCETDGCARASAQVRWLRRELDRHPSRCALAYWHHPLFSSGTTHGPHPSMRASWRALDRGGADVVLTGHEHNYERFRRQDADGKADRRGVREFVVGTGGAELYAFGEPLANSEARTSEAHGVLELTLDPRSYEWRFHSVPDGAYEDAGSSRCVRG